MSVDSIPMYGDKSGPEADFGLDGWDCAGGRLEIKGELGQQVQRSASDTPSSASPICSPQPDQVAFLQKSHVTFEHIGLAPLQKSILGAQITRYCTTRNH